MLSEESGDRLCDEAAPGASSGDGSLGGLGACSYCGRVSSPIVIELLAIICEVDHCRKAFWRQQPVTLPQDAATGSVWRHLPTFSPNSRCWNSKRRSTVRKRRPRSVAGRSGSSTQSSRLPHPVSLDSRPAGGDFLPSAAATSRGEESLFTGPERPISRMSLWCWAREPRRFLSPRGSLGSSGSKARTRCFSWGVNSCKSWTRRRRPDFDARIFRWRVIAVEDSRNPNRVWGCGDRRAVAFPIRLGYIERMPPWNAPQMHSDGWEALDQTRDSRSMGLRPRTSHVRKLKARRCSKCGGKLNSQQVRCRRCHAVAGRPVKRGNS